MLWTDKFEIHYASISINYANSNFISYRPFFTPLKKFGYKLSKQIPEAS